MSARAVGGAALALLGFVAVTTAASKPAAWLLEAAERPAPGLPGEVPAYYILQETSIEVAPGGVLTTTQRGAMRVLTQKGDEFAVARLPYTEKVDKLVSGRAWLVREGKTVKTEDLRKWVDLCLITDGTVFTEQRQRMISFPRETLSRDVFGYETVAARPMLLPSLSFEFSSGVPLGAERLEIVLPPGWQLEYVARGEGLPPPVVHPARNSWSWEVRDLPYVPEEEWTPRVAVAAPRLFVTIIPPAGARGVDLPRLQTWGDVGAWVEELGRGQCDVDANLTDTARRLTADRPKPLARLRGVCGQVQNLRYVAVHRGLGLGFGYKPRKATEVLVRGYGDCKDKANLLCALLREIGIKAYMVVIESGRRHPTEETWPSPAQFNHVINAIEVDATVDLPAVVTTADGRRLLLFDPTDEFTALGDLPWYLQGATGLLIAGADSFLLTVPELPHDRNWRYTTRAQLTVAGDGMATGQVTFSAQQQAARGMRGMMRHLTSRELTERASRYMSSLLRGVLVTDPRFVDGPESGDAAIEFALQAPGLLQPGPGGLFIMRLDVFNRDSVPQLPTKERVQPIEIRPVVHEEEVEFVLPDGLVVDDAPKPVREESAYGVYERAIVMEEGRVILRRRLQMTPHVAPAEAYADVRAFLTAAARADKASLVLRRAP